jgi:hypothetical protein
LFLSFQLHFFKLLKRHRTNGQENGLAEVKFLFLFVEQVSGLGKDKTDFSIGVGQRHFTDSRVDVIYICLMSVFTTKQQKNIEEKTQKNTVVSRVSGEGCEMKLDYPKRREKRKQMRRDVVFKEVGKSIGKWTN